MKLRSRKVVDKKREKPTYLYDKIVHDIKFKKDVLRSKGQLKNLQKIKKTLDKVVVDSTSSIESSTESDITDSDSDSSFIDDSSSVSSLSSSSSSEGSLDCDCDGFLPSSSSSTSDSSDSDSAYSSLSNSDYKP